MRELREWCDALLEAYEQRTSDDSTREKIEKLTENMNGRTAAKQETAKRLAEKLERHLP